MNVMHIIACSGPNALRVIMEAKIYAATLVYISWGTVGFSLGVALLRSWPILGGMILLPLMVFHPGYWLSAVHGDCGEGLRNGSTLWTMLLVACGLWIIRRSWSKPVASGFDVGGPVETIIVLPSDPPTV
jgi:hypothetical protein